MFKNTKSKMTMALLGSTALMACFENGKNPVEPVKDPGVGLESGINRTPGNDGLVDYSRKAAEAKAIQERDALEYALNGSGKASSGLAKTAASSRAIGWIKGKNACPTLFSTPTSQIRLTMDDEDSWSSEEYLQSRRISTGAVTAGGFPLDLTSRGLAVSQSTSLINSSEINFCRDIQSPILYPAREDYATALFGDNCPMGGFKYSITIDNEDSGNANSTACVTNCNGYGIDLNNPLLPGNATRGGALNGSTTLFMCFVPKGGTNTIGWAGTGVGVFAKRTSNFMSQYTDASAILRTTRQANPSRNDYSKFNYYDNSGVHEPWTDDLKARAEAFFFYPPSSVVEMNFSFDDVNF